VANYVTNSGSINVLGDGWDATTVEKRNVVPGEICRIGLNLILTMDLDADSGRLTDSMKLNKAECARHSNWCMLPKDLPK
jgi:hypothetical protein